MTPLQLLSIASKQISGPLGVHAFSGALPSGVTTSRGAIGSFGAGTSMHAAIPIANSSGATRRRARGESDTPPLYTRDLTRLLVLPRTRRDRRELALIRGACGALAPS